MNVMAISLSILHFTNSIDVQALDLDYANVFSFSRCVTVSLNPDYIKSVWKSRKLTLKKKTYSY